MHSLLLYEDYSREEVHNQFSPNTLFTQNAGSWGLHGIISIREEPGNFVFFVTFGQQQANHVFDEWVTKDGIISWQSQPRQNLKDKTIQRFIHHNEDINTIYLFLRTRKVTNYTFLGKLKYLAHHPDRENPVWIYWQILDWNIPSEVLHKMNLVLRRGEGEIERTILDVHGSYHVKKEPSHQTSFIEDSHDAKASQSVLNNSFGLPSKGSRSKQSRKRDEFQDIKYLILEQKVAEIRRYLNGECSSPTDEILCDWVSFCYSFELYTEGIHLFRLINPNNVNEWYYNKTKKIAKICELKSKLVS